MGPPSRPRHAGPPRDEPDPAQARRRPPRDGGRAYPSPPARPSGQPRHPRSRAEGGQSDWRARDQDGYPRIDQNDREDHRRDDLRDQPLDHRRDQADDAPVDERVGVGRGGHLSGPYRLPPRGFHDLPPGDPPLERPDGSGYPKLPRSQRRRRRRRVLRLALLLVVAYVAVLVGVPVLAWDRVDKLAFEPTGERPVDASGTNYLIVGSDSREGLTPEEKVKLGTGSATGRRTDTIMLLHVPTVPSSPTMVSIPRDSYLPIPGVGRNKVNAAYAFGGPKLLARTLEDATGLRIDGYVQIGFGGFVDVVDGLGGVRMCLPRPVKDAKAHIDLPAGCQNLRGANALGYVRARHFDPLGDLGRVKRQREFMSTVMKETLTGATLTNPVRYRRVALAYGDALTVGDTTGAFDLARFSLGMLAVSSGRGKTLTVPVADPFARTPAGSAVVWDRPKALKLFDALRTGDPIPKDLVTKGAG